MTIVPIGKLTLQAQRSGTEGYVQELVRQIKEQVVKIAGRMLEENLESEIEQFSEKAKHVRRKRSKRKECGGPIKLVLPQVSCFAQSL